MASPKFFSSVTCELKIIQVKAVQSKPNTSLFVRCYLPLGNYGNKRSTIGINTREIPAKKDHVWNDSFTLECRGTEGSTDVTKLKKESLVLELRMRKTMPVFGATFNFLGSKILGMAQIPLKDVVELPNMLFDKWVTLVATRGSVTEGVKPAKLKVEIRARVLKDDEILEKKRLRMGKNRDKCGCKDGHDHGRSYDDYDVFALAGALAAF